MTDLPVRLFDCDNHIYEPTDAVTRYLPKEALGRAITPVTLANGEQGLLAGGRLVTGLDHPDRHGPPARRAQGDAAPDEVRQADRGLRARAAAPGVPRTRRPAGADGPAGHRERHPVPRDDGHDGRALRAGRQAALRQRPRLQPVPARRLGFRLPVADLHAGAAVAARPRPGREGAGIRARPGRQVHHAERRPAYGRSPADSYFDPFWARINEAGASVAYHIGEFWYNENVAPAWGLRPGAGVLRDVGLAVAELLGTAPDRRDPLGADLRQPLRPLPRYPRRRLGVRRRMGAAVRPPDGQEPGHGPARPVARRGADRAAERHLRAPRAGRALPRGRRREDRHRSRAVDLDRHGFGLPARRRLRRAGRLRPPHREPACRRSSAASCTTTPSTLVGRAAQS